MGVHNSFQLGFLQGVMPIFKLVIHIREVINLPSSSDRSLGLS
jgi:hypothetical protein